jgi:hypothetical protein
LRFSSSLKTRFTRKGLISPAFFTFDIVDNLVFFLSTYFRHDQFEKFDCLIV